MPDRIPLYTADGELSDWSSEQGRPRTTADGKIDVEGEGDPVTLATARTRTFARRRICLVSTATVTGGSRNRLGECRPGGWRPAWKPCRSPALRIAASKKQ